MAENSSMQTGGICRPAGTSPGLILSILTPSVPSRLEQLAKLQAELARQIGDLPVEHLCFLDNKRRTIGEKRDALLRIARGDYVAFVDDDDWISPDYVKSILGASVNNSDVITFQQRSEVNGMVGLVEFRLGNPNEAFRPDCIIRRNAWHVCAWRRQLAVCAMFPASNYGEDWAWASKLCAIPGLSETHIPRTLHHYRHSSETTEAPPPMTASP